MTVAIKVGMKNAAGDVKLVKVGWSWTCFLFGSFYGVPWYMRKLPIYGAIGAAIGILNTLSYILWGDAFTSLDAILGIASICFCCFGGMKANELTIRNYFEKGYKFTNPESAEFALMNNKYHIV
jgi:hypothetical protein